MKILREVVHDTFCCLTFRTFYFSFFKTVVSFQKIFNCLHPLKSLKQNFSSSIGSVCLMLLQRISFLLINVCFALFIQACWFSLRSFYLRNILKSWSHHFIFCEKNCLFKCSLEKNSVIRTAGAGPIRVAAAFDSPTTSAPATVHLPPGSWPPALRPS